MFAASLTTFNYEFPKKSSLHQLELGINYSQFISVIACLFSFTKPVLRPKMLSTNKSAGFFQNALSLEIIKLLMKLISRYS